MSVVAIRTALVAALEAISPTLQTVRGNVGGSPVAGTPYQRATVTFARPDNAEISASHTEQGYLQALLCYPLDDGEDDAQARAELIRAAFPRQATITASGGIKVNIIGTAEVLEGFPDTKIARWVVPVRVPFTAYIA